MGPTRFTRTRSLVAAAAAVTVAVTAGVVTSSLAADDDAGSVLVPIVPCRLADTRPADNRVGTVATLGPRQSATFQTTGDNGECVDIPTAATAVSLNITALGASQLSFLTVWPDGDRPLAASLNPAPGQPPVPNAVVTALSESGAFNLYNESGNVDVVIDVNAYYVPTTAGTPGPEGPPGPAGPAGPEGPPGGVDTGHSTSAPDTTGTVGRFTSVAIGTDGNPIVSYWDVTNSDLKVAACDNPTCTTATTTPIDTVGSVGVGTSIAIGTNGNPIISYHDNTNGDLEVAACDNPTCTTATITPIDTTDDVGSETSIAIGTNGNPIISYFDNTNFGLKVAACDNPTCTTATITPIDTTDDVGQYTSITIGTNGNPIISYFDDTNGDLKVAACDNPTCTTATITPIDTTGDNVGEYTSITIGTNGNPIISYHDDTNDDLKVAACDNPTCTTATITPIDTTGDNVGEYTSITIGTNGNPIISYHDNTNDDLKVAACDNPTCTTATITTLDTTGDVGAYTSIVLGVGDNPVIAYSGNGNLSVTACGNATCAPYTARNR